MYEGMKDKTFPCHWISKENVTGYLFKSEKNEDDDVLILAEDLPGLAKENAKQVKILSELIPQIDREGVTVERIKLVLRVKKKKRN
jgi:hypothetical protein